MAIQRAAKKAGVAKWSPNQLRHSMGTEVRKKFGLPGASAYLDHDDLEITRTYAERNIELGMQIAVAMG